jgi:hypothetical protein
LPEIVLDFARLCIPITHIGITPALLKQQFVFKQILASLKEQ